MQQWWESAPVVTPAPQQQPQRQEEDWWSAAPLVEQAAPQTQRPAAQTAPTTQDFQAPAAPGVEDWPSDPNDLTGKMKPEFAAQSGDNLGRSRETAYDLSALTGSDIPGLTKGAWVRNGNETWQLSGDAWLGAPRAGAERASEGVFIDRPNAARSVEAFATAASEQVPFLDEAAALTAGAMTGRGYDAIREQQMLTRDLLNQTNRSDRVAGGISGAGLSLALPGGSLIKGATGARAARAAGLGAGYGGLFGFANTDGGLQDRAVGAGIGAGLGFAAGGALQFGGDALASQAAKVRANPSPQRILSNAGVDLTPGQMAGGALRRIEDGLTSVPILGDAIRDAQRRGLTTMNRAAYDWALEPISQTLPRGRGAGRDAYATAEDMVGSAYTSALNGVTVDPAQGVNQAIAQVRAAPRMAGPAQADVTNTIDDIGRRFSQPLNGPEFKQIESEINAAIRAANTGSQSNPSLRQVAGRLGTVKEGLNTAFDAADPFAGIDKRAADEAFARLARIRDAQQRPGTAARDGIFTASDLNSAVRAGDSSAGNRAYARGEALGQGLADAASQVLPATVPDSGTPFRSLLHVVPALATSAGAGHVGVPFASAGAAVTGAGLLGGAGLYSRPAQRLFNGFYRAKSAGAMRQALANLQREAARNPALAPTVERLQLELGLSQASDRQPPLPVRP